MSVRNRPPRLPSSWKTVLACLGLLSATQRIQRGGGGASLFAHADLFFFPIGGGGASPPTPAVDQPLAVASAGARVSGFAFFDTNGDGSRENANTDWGVYRVDVYLYTCADARIETAKTNSLGQYSFWGLAAGQYYVFIPETPQFYAIADAWNGKTDEVTGELLHPGADNAVNPETGRTECFALGGGEQKTVSFGLKFDSSPQTPRPTPPPVVVVPPPVSSSPSNSPVTPPPTGRPSDRPTTSPPTKMPSKSPTPAPTPPPPTGRPSDRPTTSSPTKMPSKSPTPAPTPSPTQRPSSDPTSDPTAEPTRDPSANPTPLPSIEPTVFVASAPPSVVASDRPSTNPTISASPTATPRMAPTRTGESQDPITIERLMMNIRGIGQLEDVDAWQDATSEYIMTHFNATNSDPRVFDVSVSIRVTKQTSSNAELFNRRLSWFRNGRRQNGERRLQSQNVEVMYDQTATYKAPNPAEDPKDDAQYIALTPFSGRPGLEQYMDALQRQSSYYASVTSVGSVMVDPPIVDPPIVDPPIVSSHLPLEKEGISNTQISIIVAVCAGGVLVASLVLIALRRRREKSCRMEPSGARSVPTDAMTYEELEGGMGGGGRVAAPVGHRQNNLGAQGSSKFDPDALLSDEEEGGHDVTIYVIAPPGKLGVIVDTAPEGGSPFVCEIKETSPLRGEIRLEDKIVAVDNEDVQRMDAVEVSRILARKSRQPERKITVVRRVPEGTQHDMDFDVDDEAEAMAYDAYNDDEATEASTAVFPKKERRLDLVAPAGKLGVVLVTPEPPAPPGPAYVFNIREDSPLNGKAIMGDKIVAVDGQDVRAMTAINVSKLLASKSTHARRKITVLREVDEDDDDSSSGRVPSPSTSESSTDSEQQLDFSAPAGKIGLILISPKPPGPAKVFKVQDDGVMVGKIEVGDRIIAVDGEDMTEKKAPEVSKLLGARRNNPERKITVLRGGEDDKEDPREAPVRASVRPKNDLPSLVARLSSIGNGSGDNRVTVPDNVDPEHEVDVVAPPGNVSLILVNPKPPGPVRVHVVQPESILLGKIHVGDKIVAVDGVDVREMPARDVTRLLAAKRNNPAREITVLRAGEAGEDDDRATQASNFARSAPPRAGPMRMAPPPRALQSFAEEDSSSSSSDDSRTKVDINAPAGKLGIVVEMPQEGGTAFVSSIKEESPMRGKLRIGDRVIAVDDEDVSKSKAVDISMMLARKSRQPNRKITVLRDGNEEEPAEPAFASSRTPALTDFATSMPVTRSPFPPPVPIRAKSSFPTQVKSSETKIVIIAPPGKLGVVVDSEDGGLAYVSNIKDTSPMKDEIKLGDKVLAIDGEDVSTKTAVDISMCLARKSKQPQRKITILREDKGASSPLVLSPSSDSSSTEDVLPPPRQAQNASTNHRNGTNHGSDRSVNVIAPPGKLGVVVDSRGGSAFVSEIKEQSPMMGKLRLGDKVIAIDGEDVSDRKAVDISMMLARKSRQAERSIAVMRSNVGDEDSRSSASSDTESTQQARLTEKISRNGGPSPRQLDIIAPAGKLGVIVDSPPEGGAAYVSEIKSESPIYDDVCLGDKLLAVDGEDVSNMKAIHVSMLLGSKSRNEKRIITVLRENP